MFFKLFEWQMYGSKSKSARVSQKELANMIISKLANEEPLSGFLKKVAFMQFYKRIPSFRFMYG
jgi:hypothetical protein